LDVPNGARTDGRRRQNRRRELQQHLCNGCDWHTLIAFRGLVGTIRVGEDGFCTIIAFIILIDNEAWRGAFDQAFAIALQSPILGT
jgi:hypothetical protein